MPPLWITTPKAIRWFNYCYSLPKVCWPSLRILAGRRKIGEAGRPLALTCSISEDYARLWLYFAQKALPSDRWDFLIVDSVGDMDPAKFEGCHVIRFLNVYHGKKVDLLLRKALQADIIFLCDDDKYILRDAAETFDAFQTPNTPVISLSPRNWWKFRIGGREFLPMGSYALIFKRRLFLEQRLKFESPQGIQSALRVFPPGVKQHRSYDTADYANERLLLAGYNVATFPENDFVLGFDGLSGRRIVLLRYGKEYAKQTLLEAEHYQEASSNATAVKTFYDIVKFERLYQAVFQTPPTFVSGFSEDELRWLVNANVRAPKPQKERVFERFAETEGIYRRLLEIC